MKLIARIQTDCILTKKITLGYLRKNLQITIILEEKNFYSENVFTNIISICSCWQVKV